MNRNRRVIRFVSRLDELAEEAVETPQRRQVDQEVNQNATLRFVDEGR